jgi:hypothetical protein
MPHRILGRLFKILEIKEIARNLGNKQSFFLLIQSISILL